jgi:hypothetical protein
MILIVKMDTFLNSVNEIMFVMVRGCVLFEVRTEYLYYAL